MKNADTLHMIVHSLSEQEWNFIFRFAGLKRKKPKKLLELMDDLKSQSSYNAALLKEKYKGLNNAKFHLRQLIIRALRFKYLEEMERFKIQKHLQNEEIFYQKGIYKEAAKELAFAKELALELDDINSLLSVLLLEQHRILERETKGLAEKIDHNSLEISRQIERYQSEVQTLILYQSLFARYRSKDQITEQAKYMAPDVPDSTVTTFKGALYTYLSKSLICRGQGDYTEAVRFLIKAVAHYESYPKILKANSNQYKILLSNLATILIPSQDLKRIEALINKLRSFPDETFNEKAETFQNYVHLRLLLILNSLDVSSLPDLEEKIVSEMDLFNDKINVARQFSIYYNLMIANILKEDYSKALNWLDKILLNKKFLIRQEIQYATRIIELLIHYDLGNEYAFESKITALKTYLKRKKDSSPFKLTVLDSFRRLANAVEKDEKKKILEVLIENLCSSKEEFNKDHLGRLLIEAWARSKVRDSSIIEELASMK